jgi:microcystin-dependent protein
MASLPFLNFIQLSNAASNGGFASGVKLSNLSAAIILSLIAMANYKWLWQTTLQPISEAEYQQIIDALAIAAREVMGGQMIGDIFPTIRGVEGDCDLWLNGQSVAISDYPDLADVVPASWINGANIDLPDTREMSMFGADVPSSIGGTVGENQVTLTESEMPVHTHVQQPHSHGYIQGVGVSALGGEIPATASIVTPTPSTTSPQTAVNNNTGGGDPHNNIPQSLQINWFIVAV